MSDELFSALELCEKSGMSMRTVRTHLKLCKEPVLGVENKCNLYGQATLTSLMAQHSPQPKLTFVRRLIKLEREVQILKDRYK